jgi:hypothetical protein
MLVSGADYRRWLELRRRRLIAVAAELADRAARQDRPLSPGEYAQYATLNAHITRLENKARQVRIAERADLTWGAVDDWVRSNAGRSYSSAPRSGTRSTLAGMVRR